MLLGFGVTFQSCNKSSPDDLNPFVDSEKFANPEEYSSFVDSTYVLFWTSLQHNQPNMPISVMGLGFYSAWGNWGMRNIAPYPNGVALNNDANYTYAEMISGPWNGLYEVIGRMNDLLSIIDTNQDAVISVIGSEGSDEIRANAKALQGISLGYLSLLYDQAYIVDENSEAANSTLSSYKDVNDKAIEKLSEAAQLFENSNLTMTGWNGLVYDGDNAADLLRAFIAKFEVLQARNPMEAQNVDWARVLQNTEEEIIDLSPTGDGGDQWWHRMLIQGQDQNWARTPQKIIKMMNPNKADSEVPYPYPEGVYHLPEIVDPEDSRITSDFTYFSVINPGRIVFSSASNYRYGRYEGYKNTLLEPMDFLTSEEIDLLRAEALIRTRGNKAEAADIINNTSVTRGGLQPLTGGESDEEMLKAISYERIVEFTYHGSCNIWFYRRMITPLGNTDRLNVYYLEPNTARHMPVPGFELNFQNLPVYTFGGDQPEQ
ncbi:hypothetical protein BFP97_18635 [Roseivirga sp. 4D4]|nr:hypothetical protein BFP97_18635 [Roseivirga sp. 4D4]